MITVEMITMIMLSIRIVRPFFIIYADLLDNPTSSKSG